MQGTLARRLRVLRAERGLKINEAAERAGIMPGTLSQIERGRRRPHDVTLSKLAAAYNVPVEELIEEEPALVAPKAEAPDTGRLWQEAYQTLGSRLLDQWESELDREIQRAKLNPGAFFAWVERLRAGGRAYLALQNSLVPADEDYDLEAVQAIAPFMQRYADLFHRIEAVTLSTRADRARLRQMVEEVEQLRA